MSYKYFYAHTYAHGCNMPKPIRKDTFVSESPVVDEVIRRVRYRKTAAKKARNLMLNVENWKTFERLCKEDDVWPSEVLDEFIAIYNERRKKSPVTEHRVDPTEK
jgi:hypothetical protein